MSITFSNGPDVGRPITEGADVVALTEDGARGGLAEEMTVQFVAGLPGFPAARTFALESLGEHLHPFLRLRHLAEPEISFTVVLAGLLYPDYVVEIDEDHQASLGLSSSSDVATFVMITVPPPPQPPTANLLGPIVVNVRTGAAAQVVQHGSAYKVAEALPARR